MNLTTILIIIGTLSGLIGIFLGIWLIGITKGNLRKIAIFLTILIIILFIDGIINFSVNITGLSVNNNSLEKIIRGFSDRTGLQTIEYFIINVLILLTLFYMQNIIRNVNK
ncbi:MAG: hypothetical protein WC584_01550 [Candidatus Pacearchaeota archaeon]